MLVKPTMAESHPTQATNKSPKKGLVYSTWGINQIEFYYLIRAVLTTVGVFYSCSE